jgi:hypothetical protein
MSIAPDYSLYLLFVVAKAAFATTKSKQEASDRSYKHHVHNGT